jgi:2-polyprenyl-3-methyl-5-hydroxy-6-metoxy-1,4-benzoquinol methylase
MKKFKDVHLNEYGYYELDELRTEAERKEMFEKEYYQDSQQNPYEHTYTKEELDYFKMKLVQKEMIIKKNHNGAAKDLLDVGCGEGFTLAYFYKKGYTVQGVDYSEYGINTHNPEMRPFLLQGDAEQILSEQVQGGYKYDIITIFNVLDMIHNPKHILELCRQLLREDGILLAEVGNNYSILQRTLLDEGKLNDTYWLDNPGHPSYFNRDGLIRLAEASGYKTVDFYGDRFIDFNLFNDRTNYYEHKETGKDCHRSYMELETLMHHISPEKTLQVYTLLGEMGLGRVMIGCFKKNGDDNEKTN